jgi:hypothetical protein
VRRENRLLSTEIKDIMDQISEGGRSIHEIDKIRKRLEAEKLELEAALAEAEGALEQEENKVLRAQLELTQVRQEIERRLAEKEDEFESTRYQINLEKLNIKSFFFCFSQNNYKIWKVVKMVGHISGMNSS